MPRQAARRLAKGRVCRAPEALRGHSITLVDGGVLDIAPDGRCVLAGVGARPGRGPRPKGSAIQPTITMVCRVRQWWLSKPDEPNYRGSNRRKKCTKSAPEMPQ